MMHIATNPVVRLLAAASILALVLTAPLARAAQPGNTIELSSAVKARMLAMINAERREFGLAAVRLDPLASGVADALCKRQVYDQSVGHISTDGQLPYHRYSFAGGLDGMTENTAAWSRDTSYEAADIPGLVEQSMRAMLDEAPPEDGHRRAILDPHATHVGLGFAWRGGEVRIAHEFVRRYLRWATPPPREARTGARVTCGAKPADGWAVGVISVHYEPTPRPISRAGASRIVSYDLPVRRTDYTARSLREDSAIVRSARVNGGSPGDLAVAPDGSFTFSIPFEHGPGIYTLVTWLRKGDAVVAASNVSIRVSD